MSLASTRAVLFDLDGTLVHTAPDLTAAVNRLLGELGRAQVDAARLAEVVSKGGRAMLGVALPDFAEAEREALLPRFLALYAEGIAEHSALYPGVAEVLERLEAADLAWGIVTNKPAGLARALLQALGLFDRCPVLVGGDTLARRKPDPEPLWHACEALGIDSGRCAYVGDDERDLLAAQAAGMPGIVALWGYRSAGEEPASWPAFARCEEPLDLLQLGLPGLDRVRLAG